MTQNNKSSQLQTEIGYNARRRIHSKNASLQMCHDSKAVKKKQKLFLISCYDLANNSDQMRRSC